MRGVTVFIDILIQCLCVFVYKCLEIEDCKRVHSIKIRPFAPLSCCCHRDKVPTRVVGDAFFFVRNFMMFKRATILIKLRNNLKSNEDRKSFLKNEKPKKLGNEMKTLLAILLAKKKKKLTSILSKSRKILTL